jgi:RNA polymerase sigma-70 factor (ECF subfamily)
VRRHREPLYAFASRLTRDADRALDVTQEALLKAFANLGRYRGESAFRTWLFAIALNAVRSAARRRSRDEVGLDQAPELADPNPGPDRALSDAEEARHVARVLAQLPPRQRAAVVLRVYEELSFREIGEVLGCAEGAARVNYHHGIKKLRENLR